jgi:hypothetical protein
MQPLFSKEDSEKNKGTGLFTLGWNEQSSQQVMDTGSARKFEATINFGRYFDEQSLICA